MESMCAKCGGLIGEPGKLYGYAGKWCYCPPDIQQPSINPVFIITPPLHNNPVPPFDKLFQEGIDYRFTKADVLVIKMHLKYLEDNDLMPREDDVKTIENEAFKAMVDLLKRIVKA